METYFPFDAGAGAVVNEAQWQKMATRWLSTGAIPGYLGSLKVTADGSALSVAVAAGAAWVEGFYYENDAPLALALAAANAGNARTDRVVVRLDRANNTLQLAIVQGAPGGGPPALALTPNLYELLLADVIVPAAAGVILAGNVDDARSFAGLGAQISPDPSFTPDVVRGAPGQIDPLSRWELSNGAAPTYVNADGSIVTPRVDARLISAETNPRNVLSGQTDQGYLKTIAHAGAANQFQQVALVTGYWGSNAGIFFKADIANAGGGGPYYVYTNGNVGEVNILGGAGVVSGQWYLYIVPNDGRVITGIFLKPVGAAASAGTSLTLTAATGNTFGYGYNERHGLRRHYGIAPDVPLEQSFASPGQAANLREWYSSGQVLLAYITAGGDIVAENFTRPADDINIRWFTNVVTATGAGHSVRTWRSGTKVFSVEARFVAGSGTGGGRNFISNLPAPKSTGPYYALPLGTVTIQRGSGLFNSYALVWSEGEALWFVVPNGGDAGGNALSTAITTGDELYLHATYETR